MDPGQVVDYAHENSGIDEVNVQGETDRYMARPAPALGYKIGRLRILSPREKAKQEPGGKFDVRAFHDEVLAGGAIPPAVLETRIAAWTAAQKGQGMR